jgi:hypothetical protein
LAGAKNRHAFMAYGNNLWRLRPHDCVYEVKLIISALF